MQLKIRTDRTLNAHEEQVARFRIAIERALERFDDQVSRVDVHLSDENRNRNGQEDDKRCMIEADLGGRLLLVVSHHAPTLNQAVGGATDKISRLIEHRLGRRHDQVGDGEDHDRLGLS